MLSPGSDTGMSGGIDMIEAKATARHDKLAKSKQEKLESLEHRLAAEKASVGKVKADRKAEIKKLPKEEQAAAKEKLAKEIEEIKQKIASTKQEVVALKAEIKADKAKAKN